MAKSRLREEPLSRPEAVLFAFQLGQESKGPPLVMRVLKTHCLFAAVVSLSGCIMVPYEAPEGRVGPHADIPTAIPDSIVKGKTTRAEVLHDEGKPDGEGADWLVYSSISKNSGLGLFFCVFGKYNIGCGDARRQLWDYHRLVVRFDAQSVVSYAHVDSASCVRWTGGSSTPVPCLDVLGNDLRHEDALASIEKGKRALATYEDVRWPADQKNDCTFYGKLIATGDALYFVADADSPSNNRHVQVDPTRCPEPDSVVAFDDTEIADLAIVEGIGDHQAVKLSRKDGSHFTFQFLVADKADDSTIGQATKIADAIIRPNRDEDDDKVDDATSTHATELVADVQKATGAAPDSFGGLNPAPEGVPRTYDHIRWCSGWNPPDMPLVQSQTPCERPKGGYLVLTATGFTFQLADAGDGIKGLVADVYGDIQSVDIRDSGRWGSYSHWVVVEKNDGEIDAFDPDDSDRREEINAIFQSHLPKAPQAP